jgi:PhzF family phenazine biosynthesis protein
MKKVTVHVVHAFVDATRGGNPAGVVINADLLSDEEKQQVATKAGFSETAFISLSDVADFKTEFYTPLNQIADCGHATIAAFHYLKQIGRIEGEKSTKEITTGVRSIQFRDDMAFMEQAVAGFLPVSKIGSQVDSRSILSALGLEAVDLLKNCEPVIADNGDKGLIVPLKDEDSLVKIEPDHSAIEAICKALDVLDYCAFSPETRIRGHDVGSRMFAPLIGIPEESATGMAAGRLVCYLFEYLNMTKRRYVIEQGYLMKPPSGSLLHAELDIQNGRIQGIRVGGQAAVKGSLAIEVG